MASHAGVAMRKTKTICSHSYAGITRIRFEGLDGDTSHLSQLAPAPLGLWGHLSTRTGNCQEGAGKNALPDIATLSKKSMDTPPYWLAALFQSAAAKFFKDGLVGIFKDFFITCIRHNGTNFFKEAIFVKMPVLIVFKHQLHGWTHIVAFLHRVHSTKYCAFFKIRKAIKEHTEHPLKFHSSIEERKAQGVCEK